MENVKKMIDDSQLNLSTHFVSFTGIMRLQEYIFKHSAGITCFKYFLHIYYRRSNVSNEPLAEIFNAGLCHSGVNVVIVHLNAYLQDTFTAKLRYSVKAAIRAKRSRA